MAELTLVITLRILPLQDLKTDVDISSEVRRSALRGAPPFLNLRTPDTLCLGTSHADEGAVDSGYWHHFACSSMLRLPSRHGPSVGQRRDEKSPPPRGRGAVLHNIYHAILVSLSVVLRYGCSPRLGVGSTAIEPAVGHIIAQWSPDSAGGHCFFSYLPAALRTRTFHNTSSSRDPSL